MNFPPTVPSMPADLLMSAIVDSSDDAIFSMDLDGIVMSWNRSAQRIFGYTAPQIVGQPVNTLAPPDRPHEDTDLLQRIKRGERIDHFTTQRRRDKGGLVDISLTISPIKDHAGLAIGASVVARDVTYQLRDARNSGLLAAIIDSSDDAIVSKNLDGIITSWNQGAQRIFGYTAAEMIGRPVTVLFPPDRQNEEPQIIARLVRGERVEHFETIRVHKDGHLLELSLTISPIKSPDGRIIGASKIARDISQQLQAKRDLAKANEDLKKADRIKSEFLAIMSHELRTPLNSILGFTGVVLRRLAGPLTEEQEKQLRIVHSSATHLLHLINDVLDLSRIESGHFEIRHEPFLPADVIQRAVRTMEIAASQKRLELRTDVAPLPPMCGDDQKFMQILINLLGNAVKFTHEGHVELQSFVRDGHLVTRVTDTGIGIPLEKHGILFQPFQQVEGSARRRYEGTGLGLYLCKKLVHAMGGDIAMESEPGRGSTFTFTLPLEAPIQSVASRDPSAPVAR